MTAIHASASAEPVGDAEYDGEDDDDEYEDDDSDFGENLPGATAAVGHAKAE